MSTRRELTFFGGGVGGGGRGQKSYVKLHPRITVPQVVLPPNPCQLAGHLT